LLLIDSWKKISRDHKKLYWIVMKSYKNIQELNNQWKKYGVSINEKGELIANHEGKEYKIGQANISTKKPKK
jgi:hypothetical protein